MFSTLLAFDAQTIIMSVVLVALIAAIVVFYIMGSKKHKKQEQDAQDLINAVKPGNKVKTIGGICGIVVEVDDSDNTFVLETGTELSGKSYLKFDRQAIYQTDAVVAKPDDAKKPEETENSESVNAELPADTAESQETVSDTESENVTEK